jgi:D-glycero-D-manno-heptose 1,7-bisphosphate phosphatase
MKPRKKAVFLDRDGVINRPVVRNGKPYPPATVDEFEFLPGVDEAVKGLKAAGFLIVVVTNQPDVARGRQKRAVIDAMHEKLRAALKPDAVEVCFHDDADGCDCRKPKPGMILRSAKAFDVDLKESYMVGDRWRDVEAGINAGCKTVFIGEGYDEKMPMASDLTAKTLAEAARLILNSDKNQ